MIVPQAKAEEARVHAMSTLSQMSGVKEVELITGACRVVSAHSVRTYSTKTSSATLFGAVSDSVEVTVTLSVRVDFS